MAESPGRVDVWISRLLVYGGAVTGIALVSAAVVTDGEPAWWWWVGVPLAVICGTLAGIWIAFRLRHRSPADRQRVIAELEARREVVGAPLDRSRLAHRATKHKRAVLRSGREATAVVQFLADGKRANEFHQLVYLELEVTVPGSSPYQVKTGEYLTAASAGTVSPGRLLHIKVDPADPDRVAVDWERSLRLT